MALWTRIALSLVAGGIVDWLVGRVLPKRPKARHIVGAVIALAVLILLNLPEPLEYSVRVSSAASHDPIEGARVVLEAPSSAPLDEFTDSNGFARFAVAPTLVDANARITIQAEGFASHTRAIDIVADQPPDIIELQPVTQSLDPSSSQSTPPTTTATDTSPAEDVGQQQPTLPSDGGLCTPPESPDLYETFDDNSRSWSVGDNIDFPFTNESRVVRRGECQMSVYFQEDALTQSRVPDTRAKNLFLQAQFQLASVTPARPVRALLAFRGTESGYFVARFGSDSTYSLYLRLDDYMNPIIDWTQTSSVVFSESTPSVFAVAADGWQITLCASGAPIASATRSTQFVDGWLAVGLSSLRGTTAVADIDNVLVDTTE